MIRTTTIIRAVILAILITGCTPLLRPDPNPYAITSNMPTAEVMVCGERVMGLGSCSIERGKSLSDLEIKVQGYNSGTIRITSDSCGVEFDARYSGSKSIQVPIQGTADSNCLLAISVQPEFEGERESGLVIGSLKAFIWIRVLDPNQEWQWFSSKLSEDADASIEVESDNTELFIRGCDATIDKTVKPLNGKVKIKLSDLPKKGITGCIYEGVITGEKKSKFFSWMVWKSPLNYVPAVEPDVSFDSDKIVIKGEQPTSVISIDEFYYTQQFGKFFFDKEEKHVVRTITVGGRNIVGEYDPDGGFKWKR